MTENMTEQPNQTTKAPTKSATPEDNSSDKHQQSHTEAPSTDEKPSILSMLNSVLAAIFGIQSDKNRQKDFQQGDAGQFIALGVIAVIVLLVGMYLLVSSVIDGAA